jgi:hypothetical protein
MDERRFKAQFEASHEIYDEGTEEFGDQNRECKHVLVALPEDKLKIA